MKKSTAWRRLFWLVCLLTSLAMNLVTDQSARGQPSTVGKPDGMDQAIAILAETRKQFENVRDYECRLVKRERVNGVLLPESVMTMKVRAKPFSIYLRCESPDDDKEMEIAYVQGRNDGKMRVHPAHTLGILGFWSVDLRDPRAFEKNRHCITEAGVGTMLEKTAQYWEGERRLGKTIVRITGEEIGGHACTRIETIHPVHDPRAYYGYRCILWLDKATHLPAGAETYDWPQAGRPPGGDLLESYRYLDLHCNVGIGDAVFSH